jgi:fluoride exporter
VRGPVAVGGAVGTLARVGFDLAVPATPDGWPLATLAVNVSGALLLGMVVARVRDPRMAALLGTGVLGGWTTFSTFAVELDALLRAAPLMAVAYAVTSVVAGVAAARLGRRGPIDHSDRATDGGAA